MKPKTSQLLKELEKATKGSFFCSESEHSFIPFIWETAEKGNLVPDKLLMSEGFLYQAEISDVFPQNLKSNREGRIDAIQKDDNSRQKLMSFFEMQQININDVNISTIRPASQRYHLLTKENLMEELQEEDLKQQEFIDFLSSSCKSVEVYIAKKDDADEYPDNEFESFPLILVETFDREWIGIVPEVDADDSARRSEPLPKRAEAPLNQEEESRESTTSLLAEIKERLANVSFITRQYYEPDYQVNSFTLKFSKSKESVLCLLLEASGFFRVYQFQDFHEEAGLSDNDPEYKENTKSMEAVDEILTSNLINLREYIVGCMSIFYLYDVGQTTDGDWVGVRTIAIWT